MALYFYNAYATPVFIAVMMNDHSGCENSGGWTQRGWFYAGPGKYTCVYGKDLDETNHGLLYYAEASDGQRWEGDRYKLRVTRQAFHYCLGDGPETGDLVAHRKKILPDVHDFIIRLKYPGTVHS